MPGACRCTGSRRAVCASRQDHLLAPGRPSKVLSLPLRVETFGCFISLGLSERRPGGELPANSKKTCSVSKNEILVFINH